MNFRLRANSWRAPTTRRRANDSEKKAGEEMTESVPSGEEMTESVPSGEEMTENVPSAEEMADVPSAEEMTGSEKKANTRPRMIYEAEYLRQKKAELSREEREALCRENMQKEYIWTQSNRSRKTFTSVLACLRECCTQLHLGNKCDLRLGVPVSQPVAERHFLACKNGSDALKAYVTLLGDNVIQAEVVYKSPKSPGGVSRSVAQPDVQWKLQQLQDLGNHIARASVQSCEVDARLAELSQSRKFTLETGELILSAARQIKEEILIARAAIVLPRKKSLLELYNFPPTRRFNPPLPQDQLLSFYISSCKLVCASYQMVSKQTSPQGLSITVSECQLAYLEEVLQQLDLVLAHLQRLIDDLEACRIPRR
ncbi:rogdi-like family protein [Cooperia oncophora]